MSTFVMYVYYSTPVGAENREIDIGHTMDDSDIQFNVERL